MTLPFQSARFPGPLGTSPGGLGGRLPGPLQFKTEQVKGSATKATKTVQMPAPWSSSTIIRIVKVPWELSKGAPSLQDIEQGDLPNCPIGAILCALAHTEVGRKHIDGMITEYTGAPVKTVISGAILEKFEEQIKEKLKRDSDARPDDWKAQDKEVISNRYFTVPFYTGEVHDTFYATYSDDYSNPDNIDLVFMSSPKNVLWPAVIEKACAFKFGSYPEMANPKKHPVNEFWELLVGKKPQGFLVEDTTDLDKIRNVGNDAKRIPTIGATKDDLPLASPVTKWHGHAILRMIDANTIEVFDPHGQTKALSLEDFRKSFQAVFYGTP